MVAPLNVMARQWIILCCVILIICFSSMAAAASNHLFYPLPHQEAGSLIAAKKIIKNTHGGLWFVDVRGALIFYDGRQLKPAIDQAGNELTGITDAVMINNGLWLVKDSDAFYYSPAKTTLYKLNISQVPMEYVVENDGSALFANRRGLYRLQQRSQIPDFTSFPRPLKLSGLYSAGDSIFVALAKGVYEYRHDKTVSDLLLPEHDVTAIYQDDQQQLWFGTLNGLFLTREAKKVDLKRTDSQSVSSIVQTESGLWVGSKSGLYVIDQQTKAISHYQSSVHDMYALEGNRIHAMLRDEYGSLWIATNNGVNYLPPTTALMKRLRYGEGALPAAQINDIEQTSDGRTWLATDNGLFELSAFLKIVQHQPALGKVNQVVSRRDQLWLATERGVEVYSRQTDTWKALAIPDHFQQSEVVSLMVDHFGSVWVGMTSRLYRYWPDSNEWVSFGSHWLRDPRGDEQVTTVFEDSEYQIWVGTDYGLYLFEAGRLYLERETTKEGGVLDIYEDRIGQLWVVNNHSLQYSQTLKPLSFQGILLSGVRANPYCIVGDNNGLWVTSSKGLSYFSFTGNIKRHIKSPEGIIASEFYSQACIRGVSGKLIFGGREGVLEVAPDKILASRESNLQLTLSEVKTDNDLRQLAGATGDTLTLQYGTSINFEFSTIPFYGRPVLSYRLIKDNKKPSNWLQVDGSSLLIDSLPPGEFVLEAKIDRIGSDTGEVLQYAFNVERPWFLSVGLITIAIVMVIVCILLFLTWRARAFKDQNMQLKQAVFRKTAKIELQKKQLNASNVQLQRILSIRQNIMAQLSHELRTPLRLSLSLLSSIRQESSLIDDDKLDATEKNITHSLHVAEQILSRDTLALVEPEKSCEQLVSPIIQASCMSWQVEAEEKQIVVCLEDETEGLSVYMAPYHLEIMLGNLLSNALKYTGDKGCITVAVRELHKQLVISVSDTGKGMSEETKAHLFESYYQEEPELNPQAGFGLGLSTVKQLVELYGGDISVISYQGVGSEFILRFPVHHRAQNVVKPTGDQQEYYTPMPRVLVASEDPHVRVCLRELMEQDYNVLFTSDGYEALMMAYEHLPDLMIIESVLPGLGGEALKQRLVDEPDINHVPKFVLLVDGDTESDSNWVDGVLIKPLTSELVLAQVAQLLPLPVHSQHVIVKDVNSWKEEVKALVSTCFHHPDFSLASAAKTFDSSERQFQRKFKQEYGIAFNDYIAQFRLDQAAMMLKQGDQISDVSLSCGFNDPSDFSAQFKARTGQTPKQYVQCSRGVE
ncbi:two-component regulator propeller domain-containing protein [Photobacterium minamisatsumaniensis]|uniref:hybrid sensor histidine kinase/response regulator transcription factor n=1 Tax=Photobacterium minamisatsumaniensis TaxID=2910233 RepID=UPI003D135D72